jgi:ferritin
MQGLIDENLNNELNTLVGMCFGANRILDRDMTILSVKFTLNNAVKFLHVGFSHKFPILADILSDYQGSRDNLTIYPDTPKDDTDYPDLISLFQRFLDYQLNFEQSVKEVIDTAIELKDYNTKVFLESFLLALNKYTEQAILLVDKSLLYGKDYVGFDRDIENFFLFGD